MARRIKAANRGVCTGADHLPLAERPHLVARQPGRREVGASREAQLTALADGGAGAPKTSPDVILTLAKAMTELAAKLERAPRRSAPCRHREYLCRRVARAVQAARDGGLPKPIMGRVMELRDQLPERWQEVFAGVARVHVTGVHRIGRITTAEIGTARR